MDRDETRQVVLETMETVLELELRAVRQALGAEEVRPVRPRRRGARRQSLVDQSVQILTDEQRALHVSELVELLRGKFGRVTDRDSVSSALAKKARQSVLVRQTAPATFALLQEEQS